jgi:predicted nucleic acid-binding protein
MIILDTNVLSELTRAIPEPLVLGWVREQSMLNLGTTTINIAEIKLGLAHLPAGRRRGELERKFAGLMARGLAGRVFDFDLPAADVLGDILVGRERMGRRLEGYDGLIAAIALSRGFAVATRNTADFEGCGLTIVNPWDGPVS